MTNTELIEYYTNLLIIQYRGKVKAEATLAALLSAGIFFETMQAALSGYGILTAVGHQLDIIGKYVGVNRAVVGLSFSRGYFGYAEYGDTTPFAWKGYAKYGDTVINVKFRDYIESQQSEYNLTDDEYRVMIRLAIIRNNAEATTYNTDILLQDIFGSGVYMDDNQDMSVTYYTNAANERMVSIATSMGLLPTPAGVLEEIVVI